MDEQFTKQSTKQIQFIVKNQAKNEIQISQETKEKVEALKSYIEKKYNKLKEEDKIKKEVWESLQIEMEKLKLTNEEQEQVKSKILHNEALINREIRTKLEIKEFIPLTIIGKGAFGEVRLVRYLKTGEILAMKKMRKTDMIAKHQIQHIKAERDVLAKAQTEWIIDLKYSFQDERYLYLCMEYLPGGDLMTLLIRKEVLSEEEARFYLSEMVMAIDSVHKLNYIHRDIKPDNILINKKGHIKLSDFGLCKYAEIRSKQNDQLRNYEEKQANPIFNLKNPAALKAFYRNNRRKLAYTVVGTPDYIAPEVFGKTGYNETVDWWSAGVILFEMIVGYPPFFSEEPSITCQKIVHWKKTLVIPSDANLSPAATDLIKKLICDPDSRLGNKSVEEIKSHPFFEGINWNKIKEMNAPYIPVLKSELDTSNFDKFEEDKNEPFYWVDEKTPKKGKVKRIEMNFIDFTCKKDLINSKMKLYDGAKNMQFLIEAAKKIKHDQKKEMNEMLELDKPTNKEKNDKNENNKKQNEQKEQKEPIEPNEQNEQNEQNEKNGRNEQNVQNEKNEQNKKKEQQENKEQHEKNEENIKYEESKIQNKNNNVDTNNNYNKIEFNDKIDREEKIEKHIINQVPIFSINPIPIVSRGTDTNSTKSKNDLNLNLNLNLQNANKVNSKNNIKAGGKPIKIGLIKINEISPKGK